MVLNNLSKREEYFRKKRKRKLIEWGIVLALIFVIIGIASFISHRPALRIGSVELSGGMLLTSNEIQYESLKFMNGSYFWLFPKNSSLLYPKNALALDLENKFKRIDTIKVRLKNMTTLSVEITERKPFAIWCKTKVPDSGEESCYFMDQNSTIFATAPQFSGDAYFKYYGLLGSANPIGQEYMASTTQFSSISEFVSGIKSLSLLPSYIVAKGGDEFSLVLLNGSMIYFDTKEPLAKVVNNLSSLLNTEDFAHMNRSDLSVEYIDMRYGNKLFYKLKQ
jgi:cell division septal protein FtsQ